MCIRDRIRFAGKIQGLVADKLGITPVSISADELYEALMRGTIDAAEYSGPGNDLDMNIQEVTKYWLVPGWHQTSSVYGVMVNKAAYEALPEAYQQALYDAAKLSMADKQAAYVWRDAEATGKLLDVYKRQRYNRIQVFLSLQRCACAFRESHRRHTARSVHLHGRFLDICNEIYSHKE